MQIFVNDQILDAVMSSEDNLLEVYESVNNWTVENNKYILGFLVDQAEHSIKQLKEIKPEEIKRFDFFIGDEVEMMITTIDELDRYIDQVGTVLYEDQVSGSEDFLNLKDGMHWMKEIMNSISVILKLDLSSTLTNVHEKGDCSIEDLLNEMDQLSGKFLENHSQEEIDEFLNYLRGLKAFIMKLAFQIRMMNAEIDELMDSLEDFEQNIESITDELIQMNIDFNSGNDHAALLSLDEYTEKLNHYLSVVYALDYKYMSEEGNSLFSENPDGKKILEITGTITEQLKNLSEALENKDIVSTGDILEYELTESLKDLKPYLENLRQFLLARK